MINKKKGQKKKITALLDAMAKESYGHLAEKFDKALDSGAIDIDEWSADDNPTILIRTIFIACLTDEIDRYSAAGTCFEKQVKKDVKNLLNFI